MSSGADETVVMGVKSAASADEGRFVAGALLGGRYRILNLLGKGGMGEVYRATDLTLGQSVALKFLPVEAAANPHLLERFHGEVRVARQVSHPNVCRVYDIGEAEGLPYISMEYVDGDDLAALLGRIGRLPAEKALEISRKLCAGLAAAHARGVIHRDLKPQNIMLNKRGEVLIMDFGLAAIADQMTGAEARNGTPAYMSPEQLKGIEVTAKSDIYSLGLILYELFTGKKPFEAKSVAELIAAQESTTLAGMTTLVSDIDPAVEKVVRACLQAEAGRRPGSALAVAAALPGGDPLAAALAAGETPSPEMVAAAGKGEGLAKGWALLCLGLILLSVAGSPFVKQSLLAINHAPMDYAPEVLEQKARDVAKSFGYVEAPQDQYLKLRSRPLWVGSLRQRQGPKEWDRWLAAESPLVAWYRDSPRWLLRFAPYPEITSENPAPLEPGMVEVTLEGRGRLRQFLGVPRDTTAEVSEDAVFVAAGLDRSQFSEVAVQGIAPRLFDEQKAYTGKHPELPEVELRVEVARFRGQVTYVDVKGPWSPRAATGRAEPRSPWNIAREIFMLGASLTALIYVPLLARRNWRLGRADRRGAIKVALAMFTIGMGYWVCTVHAVPHEEMLGLLLLSVGSNLLSGVQLWVLYLALEPALRAKWPHSIVAWNRVLSGKWNDSQVAAHVLIGCAAGCALWMTFAIRQFVVIDTNGLGAGGFGLMTYGTRNAMGSIFSRLSEMLSLGLLGFFLLFGLRTLMRRDWIAAVAGALLFPLIEGSVTGGSAAWGMYALYVGVYGTLLMIMLRFGVVATMSAMLFLNLIGVSPMGTNLKAWYAPNGLLAIALILLIAGWSFSKSLGGRKLLDDDVETYRDVTEYS